ncbi:hypothetical protein MASR2M29_02030 [Spirochaetota bacterium]
MEFFKALKSAAVKSRRRNGVKMYYASGEVQFSRLFGYQRNGNRYEPILKYKNAIETIFRMLGEGKTVVEIKQVLDANGWRDSSNNLYSHSRILGIAERPIYAGYLQKGFRLAKISNLTPMVSIDFWRRVQRQVKNEKVKLV